MSERLSSAVSVRLASRVDAVCIAEMSRQYVELGVGWSWRPERVVHAVRSSDCLVVGAYPKLFDRRDAGSSKPSTSTALQQPQRDNPRDNPMVSRVGGEPVGFAIMRFGVDEAHLLLLCVEPSYRRQGVASTLLTWLENAALTAGVSIIRLEHRADNPAARRFYESLGFCFARRRPGYYAGRIDALELAKDLWDR